MIPRPRLKQQSLFKDRLTSYARTARDVAAYLPAGAEKDELLRKALQADAAADISRNLELPSIQLQG